MEINKGEPPRRFHRKPGLILFDNPRESCALGGESDQGDPRSFARDKYDHSLCKDGVNFGFAVEKVSQFQDPFSLNIFVFAWVVFSPYPSSFQPQ